MLLGFFLFCGNVYFLILKVIILFYIFKFFFFLDFDVEMIFFVKILVMERKVVFMKVVK